MALSWEGIQDNQEQKMELLERLEKLRSWGGVYSEIELSPYVQALMNQQSHAVDATVVAALV